MPPHTLYMVVGVNPKINLILLNLSNFQIMFRVLDLDNIHTRPQLWCLRSKQLEAMDRNTRTTINFKVLPSFLTSQVHLKWSF